MTEPVADRRQDTREEALVAAFVHLADTLVDDYDVIDFLHFLTERCVALVDVDEAAVMLAAPSGHLQAVASATERGRLLELFELQNHDGPCLDAYRGAEAISAPDLDDARERWPRFAPEALSVGFRAVHSVPLRLRADVIGALNLLRTEPGELSDDDARLAHALADMATIGVLQQRQLSASNLTAAGLQTALTSRIRIEQAKGVLAERRRLTVDEAFDQLRAYARRHQLKLTEVATRVINGQLDPTADPAGNSSPPLTFPQAGEGEGTP